PVVAASRASGLDDNALAHVRLRLPRAKQWTRYVSSASASPAASSRPDKASLGRRLVDTRPRGVRADHRVVLARGRHEAVLLEQRERWAVGAEERAEVLLGRTRVEDQ